MTYGIGETVNLIGSLSFMLPAVLLYQRNRNFKTAIMSLIVGTIAATVVLLTANYFVMFPLYATAMNFPMEKIFESYVAQQVRKKFLPDNWEVSIQDKGYHLFLEKNNQKFEI